MLRRVVILVSMLLGVIWGVALLRLGTQMAPAPGAGIIGVLATAFLAPGVVLAVMVGRLAQRRFFDDGIIDGQPFAATSGAEIDQRVLTNTVEQIVLALCIWPALAVALPLEDRGAVLALGLGFAVARLLFWAGYHLSPPLRGFGFAASFYPTILAALWIPVLWQG